ncbi:hypothetical protein HOK68_01600 [Candidatus Woesearchaeota archaeon]|jgi:uncharacterized protein (UPF0147 family)|nr:hypothetical protein [Candidatus Woesearchaeota archaeon]MBT4387153.1 hypothetical protein [Candidatus Woesearchaeota archaeon]MBT4596090.1 hypothetical protein [Candidatus Woesearchaeota archaeon]MBT5741688.1 hypothetical protein [Candidatus Woesearchaeota archaeon]MBT6505455.1 hypothetical protein [Candidatus Woesearchaeota archaeon]
MSSEFQPLIDHINSIIVEKTTSKGVREKLKVVLEILKDETESDVAINKSLAILEEFESDPNIDSYTRTQIYSIVSVLGQFE